ncbi:methylated-DNA--[protein]-cysteine S-methyltransferase [Volucribacter amazonae]|uniref:methylated-DNA--[protein]-cysteine S-methyltransferase n=1 Tax=Volucribacter amazonae TaxID=256731 RepID=A0A9X4PA69_9PAST|nr:methylated-DNA--[protein]-cysteine S-methyltransferase [Volucribacter amazonae]MDG6895338.1 hypothetical protein [Volucribacter amazonae]
MSHQSLTLSLVDTLTQLAPFDHDPYLAWLAKTDCPPKSYLEHPLQSEQELAHYKRFFQQQLPCSLGAFVRLKRLWFLLHHQSSQPYQRLYYAFIDTPIGQMLSIFSEQGLCLLEFIDRKMLETEIKQLMKHFQSSLSLQHTPAVQTLQQQINEYFAQTRQQFSVPLDWVGTAFQQQVWQGLININYGETRAYSEQALALGLTNATRAVANANGKNKIAIIVPCHRVVKKDGELGGYGGGLGRKRYLLALESGVDEGKYSRPTLK